MKKPDKRKLEDAKEQAIETIECSRREFLKRTGDYGLTLSLLQLMGPLGSLFQEEARAEAPPLCLVVFFLNGGADWMMLGGARPSEFTDGDSQLNSVHRSFPARDRNILLPGYNDVTVGPSWRLPDGNPDRALQAAAAWNVIKFEGGGNNFSQAHPIAQEEGITGRSNLAQGPQYASAARLFATEEASTRLTKYVSMGFADYDGTRENEPLRSQLITGLTTGAAETLASLVRTPNQILGLNPTAMGRVQSLIAGRNDAFFQGLRASQRSAIGTFRANTQALFSFYDQNPGQCVNLNPPLPTEYNFARNPTWGAFMAAAEKSITCGLTRYAMVNTGDYDHHNGVYPTQQLANQQEFTRCLSVFLNRVGASPIASNVVVLVTSDFPRTLAQNAANGTDHGSGSYGYLFSKGALPRDLVIGEIARRGPTHGEPVPWLGRLPSRGHLYAALAEKFGFGGLVGVGKPFQADTEVNRLLLGG